MQDEACGGNGFKHMCAWTKANFVTNNGGNTRLLLNLFSLAVTALLCIIQVCSNPSRLLCKITEKAPADVKSETFKTYLLLTLLSSSCQTPYVCPLIQQKQVNYWKSARTEGLVFFESLQPPQCRLMAASQQPMKCVAWDFYKLQSGQKPWRSI